MNNKAKTIFLSGFIILAFVILGNIGLAQNSESVRDFILYSEYTNIITEKGESLDLDIKINNTGKEMEEIFLSVIPDKQAEDWEAYLKTSAWKGFEVRKVELLAEEPDNSKTLKFHIKVPEETASGNYKFTLKGITKDQEIERTLDITVGITEKKEEIEEKEPGNIEMTTKYPTIENPAGKEFKFSMEVKNKTEDTLICDLGIQLPKGWNAYCTPQWKDERISSIKIDKGGTENLSLTVVPPVFIEKGEYPITFIVESGENRASIDLKTIVTGTYKLNLRTETGLLNIDTIAGEEKTFTVYFWNEGSAAIDNISFFSTKPEGWEVTFKPEKISSLPPVAKTQKPEKVEVTVKTPQRTLPGDYMISLTTAGSQDQKKVEIRTTVKTSTKWGWMGIGIIVIILAILIGIFIKLKRR
ncbi:MAG TPA: hypothetical protein DCK79_07630 [Candidatus Atribacteria bacterium]|jgi:uncharacterized membrane protein|nr:hypothetical protein [Candidatus Atribacteria bacterium]